MSVLSSITDKMNRNITTNDSNGSTQDCDSFRCKNFTGTIKVMIDLLQHKSDLENMASVAISILDAPNLTCSDECKDPEIDELKLVAGTLSSTTFS